MTSIVRQAVRLGTSLEVAVNTKILKLPSRCLSNAVQTKVHEGLNGEKIIASPYGQVTYPEVKVSDYVWETLPNYSNMIALVIKITI